MFTFRHAAGSDVGLRRQTNQDSALASDRLLAVADGMGGHAGGDVASSIAINCLARMDRSLDATPMAALEQAVEAAGRGLRKNVTRSPALAGMGTTLTAILLDRRRIALAHIGDSRAYLLRSGRLHRLTTDHTMVHSLVQDGHITAEEAARHSHRSVLTRALDAISAAKPDLSMHDVQPADRYLLCSDGLSGTVPEDRLRNVLADCADPAIAVQELINAAYLQGAPDNVTCVVADVHDTQGEPRDEPQREARAGAVENLADHC
ncbi:protein phosphatase 2C domain-containing protein [Actinomadura sp. 6K520]|uniref:PP2C family protein-serine/threonine phosphatase n=1 Tax=Actinomadura sp. 6K520 TaxID=2530364 RepID=UPI00104D3EE9|nr:protein phosphatase 2C domain-containing protein [Actinomadura sp. 6K520]TDE21351.1 serine/threonine-protein phosphatase [Actinomadura sp. 6K520]